MNSKQFGNAKEVCDDSFLIFSTYVPSFEIVLWSFKKQYFTVVRR